ncbi:DUF192 domain-containing protein [Paracoccus bogoriensis]|nr:DUF192 domain-containing protein [Paracoccus bogoriensis]
MWLNRARLVVIVLTLVAAGGAGAQDSRRVEPRVECRDDRAIFAIGAETPLVFSVEIADTPAARARGLMFRQSLPERGGMLFIYERPQQVSFWMRNTLIPLDLIFIDETGVVRHVHSRARPLDETPIPGAVVGDPDPARLMVLEIAGGEAERLGLGRNAVLAHPRLDQDKAVWPCL